MGVVRTTFLLDNNADILYKRENVKPVIHAQELHDIHELILKREKILYKKLMMSADEKRLLYVTVTRAKNILFTDGINDLLEHLNSKNMEISNA
jgi:ATP-dependent exoDNAse (exonuclease V) beta subunit